MSVCQYDFFIYTQTSDRLLLETYNITILSSLIHRCGKDEFSIVQNGLNMTAVPSEKLPSHRRSVLYSGLYFHLAKRTFFDIYIKHCFFSNYKAKTSLYP